MSYRTLAVSVTAALVVTTGVFAQPLATAFFIGDAEARLLKTGPIVTRGQHAMLLLAGVLTLALLRSLVGGLIVFASVLFGLGALTVWAYQTYSRTSVPMSA